MAQAIMNEDREQASDASNPEKAALEGAPISTKEPAGDDIPNGGFHAWMQVFGASLLVFNSWGIVNSFGLFQTYYETDLLASQSSSAISWIGTVQAFLLIIVGVVSGPFYDRGYIRTLIVLGTLLVVFGMMMTSIATKYWEVLLAQGFCVGLGFGCLYIPSVAIVSTYFSTKRALAVGITSAGGSLGKFVPLRVANSSARRLCLVVDETSLGGVLYPIIFRRLQPDIGFGWTTRIIAFIALASQLVSLAILKARTIPGEPRALLEPSAFKESPYAMLTFGLSLAMIGLYVPYFYVPVYAERILHTSPDLSFYLIAVMNAGSCLGRILPPLVADRIGSFNMLIPCSFIMAITAFTWISVKTTAGIIAFSVFYGFFTGSVLALPPTVLVALSPDIRFAGTRIGMAFGVASFGVLIGNPIAGTILDIPKGKFLGAQIFGATIMIVGSGFALLSRWMQYRKDGLWKK
ncbi:MAG: hypothetical protein Q9220_005378 [cf. Caloplaca sp. 1 TL-2023]